MAGVKWILIMGADLVLPLCLHKYHYADYSIFPMHNDYSFLQKIIYASYMQCHFPLLNAAQKCWLFNPENKIFKCQACNREHLDNCFLFVCVMPRYQHALGIISHRFQLIDWDIKMLVIWNEKFIKTCAMPSKNLFILRFILYFKMKCFFFFFLGRHTDSFVKSSSHR